MVDRVHKWLEKQATGAKGHDQDQGSTSCAAQREACKMTDSWRLPMWDGEGHGDDRRQAE